ncbi:MAG: hypothetical protein WD003_00270 [Candidatus Paceibacterota bacterium]
MNKGFIQIPILIAILVGVAVLGGTGYVAYEVGQKSSDDIPESTTATTTAGGEATTTSDSTDVEKEQPKNIQTKTETSVPAPTKVDISVDTEITVYYGTLDEALMHEVLKRTADGTFAGSRYVEEINDEDIESFVLENGIRGNKVPITQVFIEHHNIETVCDDEGQNCYPDQTNAFSTKEYVDEALYLIPATQDKLTEFKNSELGFSFVFPKDWNTGDVYRGPENNHIALSVRLHSPDYFFDENIRNGMGLGGVVQGNEIGFLVFRIKEMQAMYNSVQSILTGTYQSKSGYLNPKLIYSNAQTYKVRGVQYLLQPYEGTPRGLVSQFDENGLEYNFSMDLYKRLSEEDLLMYKIIVSSFTLLH